MPLTKKELQAFRKALDGAARPLFFFDDDADGVTSFIQLYRYKHEGKGVVVKASPILTEKYVRKVTEYQPDLVIILDKPLVEDSFFGKVQTPILWLDHHPPQTITWHHVQYYNPRIHNDKDNRPTTYWAYQLVKGPLWLATVGAVADWHLPDYIEQFQKAYPDLLPPFTGVEDILFHPHSGLGKLARIISFNLKGTVRETMKSVLVLTRIDDPREILHQTTPRGKYLYRKYQRLATRYEALLARAKKAYRPDAPLLLFTYEDDISLTSDLSNELLYLYPDQLIAVARKHEGEYKYSFRSAGKYEIPPLLEQALRGIDGYGGGHTYACGGCVKEAENEQFLAGLTKALEDVRFKKKT